MTTSQKKLLLALSLLLALQTCINLFKYFGEIGGEGSFGGDFISFWQAAKNVRAGNVAAIYDAEGWRVVLSTSGPKVLAWFVYPPFALFGLWPLGKLTYNEAVLVWSLVPIPLYFGLVYLLARRSAMANAASAAATAPGTMPAIAAVLACCALPFLSANLFTGQTGAVVAVLYLGAAYFWPDRPILAGIAIGLLAIKPQMGLLIPIALVASAQWRTVAAAGTTIAVLAIAATAWLGPAVWFEYLAMMRVFAELFGQGYGGIRMLAIAPYVSMLSVGAPAFVAGIVHGICLITVSATVFIVFRRSGKARMAGPSADGNDDLRLALLATATLLATPYSLSYDMPLLMLSLIPFVVRAWNSGCELTELAAFTALLIVPFAQPLAVAWHVPFGFGALALWFWVLHRRYQLASGAPAAHQAGQKPAMA